MDVDAFVNIVGKAMTLVATAIALRLGGGLTEVILMQGVGGVSILLAGAIAALRLDIKVEAPVMKLLRELLRHGAPLATFSLVIASQPFIEILMLSALAGAAVVGWYGASTNILGIVISPAMILLAATFPELSRASRSLPDLRRMIDATGRVMFIAAAFTSSALYLFADHMVAIIYGHGRFVETASILRVSAIFVPLLFLVLVLASAMNAVGRNKAMAVISIVRIVVCVVLNWLLIGYWQQRFGNGAIALVIIAGLAEIPATIACWALLPKGAVGSSRNAQCGSSLRRLALHGGAAIDAAAARAVVSHSALCPVVRRDGHGHKARIAERSTARDGDGAQQSACAPGEAIRAGRLMGR